MKRAVALRIVGGGRPKAVRDFFERARETADYHITIDLERCEVRDDQGFRANFPIDDFVRHCLLHGLDDIGLTLQHEAEIATYEAGHPAVERE